MNIVRFEPWSIIDLINQDLIRRTAPDAAQTAAADWDPAVDIVEEKVRFTTYEIVQSICKTHKKLAIKGFNKYSVKVEKNFPNYLFIQKTLFKRVVNNIISNSLKHT